MLLNLSDVLGEHHKTIETEVPVEMNSFRSAGVNCPVSTADPLSVRIEHIRDRILVIRGKGRMVFQIPCDRCLEPVETALLLDFEKKVDLSVSDGEQPEEYDESNFIDGYELDTERLLRNEVLIGWPTKVLCKEDCKGICNVCGQNLNQGTCDCEDTGLDPRMSVIRELFDENFKEV